MINQHLVNHQRTTSNVRHRSYKNRGNIKSSNALHRFDKANITNITNINTNLDDINESDKNIQEISKGMNSKFYNSYRIYFQGINGEANKGKFKT